MFGDPLIVKSNFNQASPAIENVDICGLDEAELRARVQDSLAQLIRS